VEYPDKTETQGREEDLDEKERVEREDQLDLAVLLVTEDSMVFPDCRASREKLDHQARLVHGGLRDQEDRQESLEEQALREHVASAEETDCLDAMDKTEILVYQDAMERQEHQDSQEREVQ
jgi:hypothetical protein